MALKQQSPIKWLFVITALVIAFNPVMAQNDSFMVFRKDYGKINPQFVKELRANNIDAPSFTQINGTHEPERFIKFLETWAKYFPEQSHIYIKYPQGWFSKLTQNQQSRLRKLNAHYSGESTKVNFLALTSEERLTDYENIDADGSELHPSADYDEVKKKDDCESPKTTKSAQIPLRFVDRNSVEDFLGMRPQFKPEGASKPIIEMSWDEINDNFLIEVEGSKTIVRMRPPQKKVQGEWYDNQRVIFGVECQYRSVPLVINLNSGKPFFYIEPQETHEDKEWLRAAHIRPTGDVWWTDYFVDEAGISFMSCDTKPTPTKYVFIGFGEKTTTRQSSSKIYNIGEVDQNPSFKGGDAEMYRFISKNIIYPRREAEENIKEKIIIKFVVEKNGTIGKMDVVKGTNPQFINEVKRLIGSMPSWNPAKKDGVPVRCYFTLPVNFGK